MERWVDGWLARHIVEQMGGWMDKQMDSYMHAQMDNGMYGWIKPWVGRQKRCQADF